MSTPVEQLHTAARRYCIERYDYWVSRYTKIESTVPSRGSYTYTDEQKDVFPRYNVLNAILGEIERFRAGDFANLADARHKLSARAYAAEDMFTKPPNGPIERAAMNKERVLFGQFVESLPESQLAGVEPLFYRRTLSKSESTEIRTSLTSIWNLTIPYWYPLTICERTDVEAFQDKSIEAAIGSESLRNLLRLHGVSTLWEIREYGRDCELELAVFEPSYNGAEGYWCSAGMDWVIYTSHESSITIGGTWLLDAIKQKWPEWHSYVWTSPFF